jgi:hypothetical protein
MVKVPEREEMDILQRGSVIIDKKDGTIGSIQNWISAHLATAIKRSIT